MVVSYLSATVLKYLKMLGRKTYNKILALYKTWKMPLCQAVLKDRTITYEGFNALGLIFKYYSWFAIFKNHKCLKFFFFFFLNIKFGSLVLQPLVIELPLTL